MEIKYEAYWKYKTGVTRISHGIITEADLDEIIERKEREEWAGSEGLEFESATIDNVKL